MLNPSKVHLNRFGKIQMVKSYREIIKVWHHKEKLANESVPILKPVGSSSLCKTVKYSKVSENELNAILENPIDPTRNLKLSDPHKIMLGHLNANSIADAIQETFYIDESFPDKQFCLNNFRIFRKDRNRYEGGIMFYVTKNLPCKSLTTESDIFTETTSFEVNA